MGVYLYCDINKLLMNFSLFVVIKEKERIELKLVMVSQQHKRIVTRQKDETDDMSKRGAETDQKRCENDPTAS